MLSRIRHRAGVQRGHDAGLTLVELLVAMGLASMIGAMAVTWFVGSSTANRVTVDANITTSNARNVLQSWAWYLRLAHSAGNGGAAVIQLTDTSIRFRANIGALPSCTTSCTTITPTSVTFELKPASQPGDEPTLRQTIGNAAATAVLTGQISTTGCLFTALDANGNSLGCTNVTTTSIRGVQINFTALTSSGHSQPFQTTANFTDSTGSAS